MATATATKPARIRAHIVQRTLASLTALLPEVALAVRRRIPEVVARVTSAKPGGFVEFADASALSHAIVDAGGPEALGHVDRALVDQLMDGPLASMMRWLSLAPETVLEVQRRWWNRNTRDAGTLRFAVHDDNQGALYHEDIPASLATDDLELRRLVHSVEAVLGKLGHAGRGAYRRVCGTAVAIDVEWE